MDIKITVTEEDVALGLKTSILQCAVMRAFQRAFPDKFVCMKAPRKKAAEDGEEYRTEGYLEVMKSIPPIWEAILDPSRPGFFDTSKLPPKGSKERAEKWHEVAGQIDERLEAKVHLSPETWDWIKRFDKGELKPEDVPMTFVGQLTTV